MSAAATSIKLTRGLPWGFWLRQVRAIFRLEIQKNLLGRRSLLMYLMAIMPVAIMAILAISFAEDIRSDFGQANIVYANFYGGLVLRTIIFFGCAWIFMNLFRGEIVDRSLHYYFLSPVRREVLVAGKYLSGLFTSIMLFGFTTVGSIFLIYAAGHPASTQHLATGPGLKQVLTYTSITVLGCLGYGAVFLVIGLFFRNPIIPGVVLYGWEFINFLLPPVLKKISVIHYLHSLSPVPLYEGPFAIVAEPTPAYLSVPGLFVFTVIMLYVAALRSRRMEITYARD